MKKGHQSWNRPNQALKSHPNVTVKTPTRSVSIGKVDFQVVHLEIGKSLPSLETIIPSNSKQIQSHQAPTFLPSRALSDPHELFNYARQHPNKTFLVKKSDLKTAYEKEDIPLLEQATTPPSDCSNDPSSKTVTTNNPSTPLSLSFQLQPHQVNTRLSRRHSEIDTIFESAPKLALGQIVERVTQERRSFFDRTTCRPFVAFSAPEQHETDAILAVCKGDFTTVKQIIAFAYFESLKQMKILPEHFRNLVSNDFPKERRIEIGHLDKFLDHVSSLPEDALRMIRNSGFFQYNINAQFAKGGSVLHHAALHGHVGFIPFLISHGADVNLATSNGSTPLHWAAGAGWLSVVKSLVKHGADVHSSTSTWCVDVFGRNSGQFPIHWAASSGHDAVVRYLHELSPAMITCNDEKDNTALSLSQKGLHFSTTKAIQDILNEEYVPVVLRVFTKSIMHSALPMSSLTPTFATDFLALDSFSTDSAQLRDERQ